MYIYNMYMIYIYIYIYVYLTYWCALYRVLEEKLDSLGASEDGAGCRQVPYALWFIIVPYAHWAIEKLHIS